MDYIALFVIPLKNLSHYFLDDPRSTYMWYETNLILLHLARYNNVGGHLYTLAIFATKCGCILMLFCMGKVL